MSVSNDRLKMFRLDGRKALVTGGSKGIGNAIATALADAGAEVAITGRDATELKSAAKEIAERSAVPIHPIAADHSDWAGSPSVIDQVIREMQRIDILVNNAGTGFVKPIEQTSDQEWSHIVHLNLFAPMALIRAAAPQMKERRWGRVINISSFFAVTGLEDRSAYSASKGGLTSMTRALAAEFAPDNVLVNAIGAGPIRTPRTLDRWRDPERRRYLSSMTALGRWGEPEDLAGIVLCLASEAGNYITGQMILVDGGASTTA